MPTTTVHPPSSLTPPVDGSAARDAAAQGAVEDAFLDRILRRARTHGAWLDRPVDLALVERAYDLAKMGPTSANCLPMRIAFAQSRAAKERLRRCLDPGNVEKTMAAPLTAIVAFDRRFYDHLPRLFPHADARSWFVGDPAKIEATAFRNGTLQGGYFMLALRALGLDCGPMSGFDHAKVDLAFFAGTSHATNFLLNIGYGDASRLAPRGPRLDFAVACTVV